MWRRITFTPVQATAVRVYITGTSDGRSRIAELEAWTAVGTSTGGGPAGAYPNYRCSRVSTAQCYSPSAPAVTNGEISTFMANAALNWGCTIGSYQPCATGQDYYCRYYPKTSTPAYSLACKVYWNTAKQAAYVMLNDTNLATSAGTNTAILTKWQGMGAASSVLGDPVSNPVAASWTGTTYQFFANGTITHNATYGAKYAGGTHPTDLLVDAVWRARFGAGPGSPGNPPAYPLMQDPSCTAGVVGSESCTVIPDSDTGRTGRFSKFRDLYVNQTGWILARDGWTRANVVEGFDAPAFISAAGSYPLQPWSVGLGFPLENVKQIGVTGGATPGYPIANQQFENGYIRRQPSNCGNGALTPTAILGSASPITTANVTPGFCPGATIGPICVQSEQVPVDFWTPAGNGSYTYRCGAGPANWPNGIRFDITKNGDHRVVDVNEPILTRWRTDTSGVVHPVDWAIRNYKKLPLVAAITSGGQVSQSFVGGNVSTVGACSACGWRTTPGAQCFDGPVETNCGPASGTRSNAPVWLDVSIESADRTMLYGDDGGHLEYFCGLIDYPYTPCNPTVGFDGIQLREDPNGSASPITPNDLPPIDLTVTRSRAIEGPHQAINAPFKWEWDEDTDNVRTTRRTEIAYVLMGNVYGSSSYSGEMRFYWDEDDGAGDDDYNWDAPLGTWINRCLETADREETWWYPDGSAGAQLVSNTSHGTLCETWGDNGFGACSSAGEFEVHYDVRCSWHY